jgi:hypothetical protein
VRAGRSADRGGGCRGRQDRVATACCCRGRQRHARTDLLGRPGRSRPGLRRITAAADSAARPAAGVAGRSSRRAAQRVGPVHGAGRGSDGPYGHAVPVGPCRGPHPAAARRGRSALARPGHRRRVSKAAPSPSSPPSAKPGRPLGTCRGDWGEGTPRPAWSALLSVRAFSLRPGRSVYICHFDRSRGHAAVRGGRTPLRARRAVHGRTAGWCRPSASPAGCATVRTPHRVALARSVR